MQAAQVLRPKRYGEQNINGDRNLSIDEANATPLQILGNFRHQLLGKKEELGAKALGFQLPQEALFFAVRSKGTVGSLPAKRFSSRDFLRGCADVVLGDLDQGRGQSNDEGVGLALGLVVVIAKDRLEPLRPNQIGERGNFFAVLNQDGSCQAQMLALLTERGGGQAGAWAPPVARRRDRGWHAA